MTPRSHTLVVGGTKGIGRAIVGQLAGTGGLVSVIGRSKPAVVQATGVRTYAADVNDADALQRALGQATSDSGAMSAVVLLQRFRANPADAGSADAAWAGEIATSLTATRLIFEWAGEHLEDRGDGKAIVAVGSVAGVFVASEQPVSYHMAKAGLAQMVRYYAVALGPKGIRVNAVSPGTTVKEESREFYRAHPELVQLYRDIVPLGRMGTSDDVANLVEFLLSPRAAFVTGQNIVIDGGVSLKNHESLARGVSPLKDLPVTQSTRKPS